MRGKTLMVARLVWVAAVGVLMVTWNETAWVLLLLLPALAPLMRELAPAPDLDERQRLLDYRASHYALMVS